MAPTTLQITDRITLTESDLDIRFVRSGGPGGQNVNKVATKAELRFHLDACEALSDAAKRRFRQTYPGYVTDEGDALITSTRHRSQARNREDAEQKLAEMIRAILKPPKPRKKRGVSQGAKRRRVEEKRKRSATKQQRRTPRLDD